MAARFVSASVFNFFLVSTHMPHAVLEYSANLDASHDPGELVATAHAVMTQCGLFSPNAIKTRAYKTQHFCVGEQGSEGMFLHVTIQLLEGRTLAQRSALTQAMFDALRPMLPEAAKLSVDSVDMVKETYRK